MRRVVTPSEPVVAARRACRATSALMRHSTATFAHARGRHLGRRAPHPARGRHHRVNEDWHSPLDGPSPSSSSPTAWAAARWPRGPAASSWLTCIARSAPAASTPAPMRDALLDADREIARAHRAIAPRRPALRPSSSARAADPLRATWLIAWVGDCRVYRVGGTGRAAQAADPRRHLRASRRAAAARRLARRSGAHGRQRRRDAPNVARVALRPARCWCCAATACTSTSTATTIGATACADERRSRAAARAWSHCARARGSEDDATVLGRAPPHASRAARALRHRATLVAALVAAAAALRVVRPRMGAAALRRLRPLSHARNWSACTMTPEQIDRVFGRGRLKMVTGEHVEVFREAVARRRDGGATPSASSHTPEATSASGPSANGASSRG